MPIFAGDSFNPTNWQVMFWGGWLTLVLSLIGIICLFRVSVRLSPHLASRFIEWVPEFLRGRVGLHQKPPPPPASEIEDLPQK